MANAVLEGADAVAITPNPAVRNQLALSWGTEPVLVADVESSDAMVRIVDQAVLALDGFVRGEGVVIVAGWRGSRCPAGPSRRSPATSSR